MFRIVNDEIQIPYASINARLITGRSHNTQKCPAMLGISPVAGVGTITNSQPQQNPLGLLFDPFPPQNPPY
jgi:hypothetical protein